VKNLDPVREAAFKLVSEISLLANKVGAGRTSATAGLVVRFKQILYEVDERLEEAVLEDPSLCFFARSLQYLIDRMRVSLISRGFLNGAVAGRNADLLDEVTRLQVEVEKLIADMDLALLGASEPLAAGRAACISKAM
jgi:hypothetical protein